MESSKQITQMLNQWIQGDVSNEVELFNEIYPLLRKIAHKQLSRVNNKSLNTTIMVNEVYLKYKLKNKLEFNNKNHFIALSARLIRNIIIDEIRKNNSQKRGGLIQHLTLEDNDLNLDQENMNIDWLYLHDLLNELDKVDPESTKLIELRFFIGLNLKEIAEIFNSSTATISRKWLFARSWLYSRLNEEQ